MSNVINDPLAFFAIYSTYAGILFGIIGTVISSTLLYNVSFIELGIGFFLMCIYAHKKDLNNV